MRTFKSLPSLNLFLADQFDDLDLDGPAALDSYLAPRNRKAANSDFIDRMSSKERRLERLAQRASKARSRGIDAQ